LRLGVPVEDCLVFEDAAVGIAAGVAAGADVLVVTATHRPAPAAPQGQAPDMGRPSIADYAAIAVSVQDDGRLRLVASAG
jgi:sugar-phosphatase